MMIHRYTDEKIKCKVEIAIGVLLKNDSFLLEAHISERSVSHKLAEYLQSEFPDWNVDVEYNKKGLDPKELYGIRGCSEEKGTDLVLPDIIIHKRNKDENLLVVEIKTDNRSPECDFKKLELFTLDYGIYKYNLGLFIKFEGLNMLPLIWYKHGIRQN